MKGSTNSLYLLKVVQQQNYADKDINGILLPHAAAVRVGANRLRTRAYRRWRGISMLISVVRRGFCSGMPKMALRSSATCSPRGRPRADRASA